MFTEIFGAGGSKSVITAAIIIAVSAILHLFLYIRYRQTLRRTLLSNTAEAGMRDVFIILDDKDNFLEANEHAIRLFPELAEAKRGEPVGSLKNLPNDFEKTIKTRNPKTNEETEQTRHYITSATTLEFDGKRVGTGIIVIDNTENFNLLKKYENLSQIDERTRLYKKSAFITLTSRDFALQLRKKTQGCLLTVDIDFLEYVNRVHGTDAGDAAVAACAEIIHSLLRKTDLSGANVRGDFAVWLPDTPLVGGIKVAEKIRESVAETILSFGKENVRTVSVTVSAGIAEISSSGAKTLEELLEYADMSLYMAKHSGRNRVCMWQREAV